MIALPNWKISTAKRLTQPCLQLSTVVATDYSDSWSREYQIDASEPREKFASF